MLKHFLVASGLLTLLALPAAAQNASEIARAQSGQDCRGCNLFQVDLAYQDHPGINLAGSRMIQANMSLATLDRAKLAGANLSHANLFGARLTSADLSHTDLSESTLVGAYFGSANLTGAVMKNANLSGAELQTTRGLTQAQLSAACGDRYTRLPSGLTVKSCR